MTAIDDAFPRDIGAFLFPSLLVRGAGALGDVAALLRARGLARGQSCVVVADAEVHALGLLAPLLASLERDEIDHRLVGQVSSEPDAELIERVIDGAGEVKAAAVIGVGGGSALDTAKLVAYRSASATPLEAVSGQLEHVLDFPTLVLIPTTVGTGAEATRVAMFSIDGSKRAALSAQFVPDIAVLDPELARGLPGPVVAATALDALSHAIESMMSASANTLTASFAATAARSIVEFLEQAVAGDFDARAELLFASFQAGVALNAGVVLGHSMSYVISSARGLPHGVGCAVALPYCLAYNQAMERGRSRAIAAAVLGDRDAPLRDVAMRVADLARAVDLPTGLQSPGEGELSTSALATATARDYPRPNNPIEFDVKKLDSLFEHLIRGDLPGAWASMGGIR